MNAMRNRDDEDRVDRSPFNIQADYRETDFVFRKKLGGLVPKHLAERVQKVLERRLKDMDDNSEAV